MSETPFPGASGDVLFVAEALPAALRRPFSREEFARAGTLGVFGPGERLELIGGEVVRKMSPQDTRHATSITLVADALRRAFRRGAHVRVQLPLALGRYHEPEPDLAVVSGAARDYAAEHPSTALLVVEISDSTLRFDRGAKASLYAQVGIADYWVVDVADRVVEVFREPGPMADQIFGAHYRSVTRLSKTDRVAPLAAPAAEIPVSALLP